MNGLAVHPVADDYGGTIRQAAPETTWRRLQPHLAAVGITRVADVTLLDDLGIPVWQAIRPNSANLTVSQGKGPSHLLARVSAAMEAFELHCAEEPQLARRVCRADEIGLASDPTGSVPGSAAVPASGPVLLEDHLLGPGSLLECVPVEDLADGTHRWWPLDAIAVDFRIRRWWQPPGVRVTSNGLASGNTLAEATLHGLLELVERHSLAHARAQGSPWQRAHQLVPGNHGIPAELADRFASADALVEVVDVTHPVLGIPSFLARVWSPSLPRWFSGSGSHGDPAIALSRALTEAAQSRVTAIAGARDDVGGMAFDFAAGPPPKSADRPVRTSDAVLGTHAPPPARLDLETELLRLTQRCNRLGATVLRADLTVAEYGIPVVRVVAPGLAFTERHGHG
ncbi:YcaO-like family protein [Streptomyces sp. NPDC006140]|uniref:YcaO-like family protein n=1 Tax=Streptomyces sp. NPDC006140 TaxID=3154579 RepID=UPI0033DF2BBF